MKELTKTALGTLILAAIFSACSPLASSVSKHSGSGVDSNSQGSKTLQNAPEPVFTNTSAPGPSPSPSASPQSARVQSNWIYKFNEENNTLDFAAHDELDLSFNDTDHETLTPEEFQSLKSRDSVEISKNFTHLTIEVTDQDVDLCPEGLKFVIKKTNNGRFELAIDTQSSPEATAWFKAKGLGIYLH